MSLPLFGSVVRRPIALVVLLGLVVAMLPFGLAPAGAAPALSVTPITFDVIGLDSNSVATGPNLFPVGARACNTGDVTLTGATAALVFEGAINPYLAISGPSTISVGTLAPGQCRDVYFNVAITRTTAAYDTFQRYYIQVTTAEGATGRTPQPRQLYIEQLVSQNRNSVTSLTGPSTVYVGGVYTYTLTAKTATQGYEQLETFLTLDGVIFQVLSTTSTYSAPAGGTNDKLYADACGLQKDPTLANYRECVGPIQYAGGKAGGDITVTYVVRVLSSGSASLVPLIYDLSGASYHYNSDFGALTAKAVQALPAAADLSVTKTASTTTPTVGSNVTFTVGLANGGPTAAANVEVSDVLPAGLTYVSHVAPAGSTYTPATGIWAVPTLAVGATTNLTVTATVTSGGTIVNTAEVLASSVPDPDSTPGNGAAGEDDRASVTLTPPRADLSVAKTVSSAAPNVGQNVTFTVTVTNSGPATPATNVQVSDVLPPGLAFVSATASSGSYDTGTGLWTVGPVPLGTPRTLSIVATVTATGPITNVASVVAADQLDPDSTAGNGNPSEDDQASVTLSAQQADLSVSKSASTVTPNVGSTVTFTVGVANAGPDTATNLTVRDQLPTGLTFVSAAPSQGSYDPVTGGWFVGSVAPGGSATLAVVASVTASTPVVNTASVSAVDQRDPDSTPGNGAAGEDDQASVTVTPQRADLSLTKVASTAAPNVGQTMTFTVEVANAGPSTATGVVVADPLPAGVSFVSAAPSAGSYVAATGLWAVGSVPAGASRSLVLTVVVTGSTAFTNTAAVQASDQFDPDSVPGNGAAGEDDQASVTVTPQRADLSVSAAVDDASPNVGDQVVFSFSVANGGPSAATRVSVATSLPAGVTVVGAVPSTGTFDPVSGVWAVGGVAALGSANLQVTVVVDEPGAKTASAWVAAADQFDPDSTPGGPTPAEDDVASVLATPQEADLSVTAVASASTVPVGGTTTFSYSVTNGGPNAATSVVVAVPVPGGSGAFVSSAPSAGTSYDSTTGAWSVSGLANGATATLDVVVTVGAAGPMAASVEVVSVDQFDPDSTPGNGVVGEDDLASASVVGVQSDLSLTLAVDDPTPDVGQAVTFTVVVTNGGPTVATGVSVRDLLPAGLTFASASASQGSYSSVTGLWTVGTLGVDGSATLTLSAVISSPSAVSATAEVWASDLPDPDSTPGNGVGGEDDAAAVAVAPEVADLSAAAQASELRPDVGDTVSFTVTLTNAGPSPAVGVAVSARVPSAGFGGLVATPSQGTYDPATGVWTVGTVASGTAPTLVLAATATSAAASTLAVEVQASSTFDPDSTPGNSVAGEDDQASVTVTPRAADLRVAKVVVGSTAVDLGDEVTFTVTLFNEGPDGVTGVVVTDLLPAGLTYSSSVPGAGTSYDPVTGAWAVPALADGASISLAITAVVAATGPLTNTASVSDSSSFDPASANDSASATVVGRAADLRVVKTAPASVAAGATVTFTISVTNDGPSDALDVVLTDPLPAGLGSPSTPSGECSIGGGVLTCSLGTVAVGTTRAVTVSGTAPASGSMSNTASVTSSTPDTDPSDSSSTVVVTVADVADLRLTKAGPATVLAGSEVEYLLTVTNDGPSPATGVVVTDPLPAGLVAPTTTSSGCTVVGSGSSTLVCSLASPLANGASMSFSVRGRAPASPGVLTNTASVASSTVDPDGSDDSSSVSTTVTGVADLSVTKSAPLSVVAGGSLTYVIGVANAGPSTAVGVEVTDVLPAGFGSPSTSSPGCSVAGGILSCSLGDLASGSSVSVSVTGAAPSSGSASALANTATVSSSTFDPSSSGNSSSVSSAIVPRLSLGDVSVGEGGSAVVGVTLSNPSAVDVTLSLSTVDGSAVAGAGGDYVARSGVVVTIPAGSVSGSFTVATLGDAIDEPDETLSVVVGDGSVSGAVVADGTGVVTIVDDDPVPAVSLAGGTAVEGSSVPFTVSLSNPSSVDVVVSFATSSTSSGTAVSGVDFTPVSSVVTIPAGSLSAVVPVPTLGDPIDEPAETIVATLSTGASAVGTITDDDPAPAVSLTDAVVVEGSTASVTVTLSNPSSTDITVGYATATGSATSADFTAATGTIIIPAGSTTATITVATTPDPTAEPDEQFTLSVTSTTSNATTGDSTASTTILDDDTTPQLAIADVTITEGAPATFTITLTNPSAADIVLTLATVDGSATAGTDYTPPPTTNTTTITITAGQTTATVVIPTTADADDETTEQFRLVVQAPAPSNATITDGDATATILDDDNTVRAVDDTGTTAEDTPTTIAVLTNDTDVDGDTPLTIISVTTPTPTASGAATINPDGTITFTPAPNTNGTTTLTYTVRDSRGAEDTATITIVVTPVDDPPTAAPDRYQVPANTTTDIADPADGVLANDGDIDLGDTLTADLVTAPTNGTVTLRPDGTFTYRPNDDFLGTDTFTYRTLTAPTANATTPTTVTIDVGPVARPDTYTTSQGTTLEVPPPTGVLTNDPATQTPRTAELVNPPARGTLTLRPDGSFTYVPAPGASGTDTFTYRTCTGATTCSAPALVTVDVTALAPPVATDDAITADPGGTVTIPVLTNDADPDAALDPNRVTIVSPPQHGTVTVLPTGEIRYVPGSGFSGLDSFTYRLCDVAGQCDEAVVRIDVLGGVVAPVPEPAPILPVTGSQRSATLVGLALLLLLLGATMQRAATRK